MLAGSDAKILIADYLWKCDASVSLFKLKRELSAHQISDADIEEALTEMLNSGDISFTSQGIAQQPKTIQGRIGQIIDEKKRTALNEYFNGRRSLYYSTQEMKMLVKNFLKDRPTLEEDRFCKTFRRYHFERMSFTNIFAQPVSTYIYLRETCRKGRTDWRDIRFDLSQNDKIRIAAVEHLKNAGLMENGGLISCSIEGVSLYLLAKHEDTVPIKALFAEYLDFISRQTPLPHELDVSFQKFLSSTSSNHNIIFGQTSNVRYRPSTEKCDRKFLNSLKLSQYRNQYISAEIICRNSAAELRTGNVHGPHELINLLKSYPDFCEKHKITFAKAPFLVIGNGDSGKQLKALLSGLSPASGDKLAREYEKRYGVKASTVKARLLKGISQYLSNGVYDTKIKTITDKQSEKLSGQLEAPWYYITDVESLFKRRVGKHYKKYMSTENLAKLGYRKTSSIIYSNKYHSLESCLNKTAWEGNTFHVDDELWAIQHVYVALQKKTGRFEVIEYFPQKFIRLSYLKKNGIHKQDLNAFIGAVNKQTADESYFTLKSLRDCGVELPLAELGFDDMFYFSILKQSKSIQARKVAGTYLFRKSRNDATLPDFIEYLLTKLRSIDLYDLSDLLAQKYGIVLNPSYIRFITNNTQMYYDTISEKLFLDYDEYFEEV